MRNANSSTHFGETSSYPEVLSNSVYTQMYQRMKQEEEQQMAYLNWEQENE